MPSRADLAKIHIAKKELGLDDDAYRDVLWSLFEKDSAKYLTDRQAADLISHFKSLGWKPKYKDGRRRPPAESRQSRKIWALWMELHRRGIVKSSTPAALGAFVKRITGIHSMQWLTPAQANQVIEALKAWQKRTEKDS